LDETMHCELDRFDTELLKIGISVDVNEGRILYP
jgi:hypothetical protein